MIISSPHWYEAARRTAMVSGIFCLLVLGILIANGLQSRHVTEMMTGQVAALKVELREKPDDGPLQAEIRRLDLELRQAFFRRRAFAQQGAWLLLGGLAAFVLSFKLARQYHVKLPNPQGALPEPVSLQAQGRYAVIVTGAMLAGGLVGMALSPRSPVPMDYTRPMETAALPSDDTARAALDRANGQSHLATSAVNSSLTEESANTADAPDTEVAPGEEATTAPTAPPPGETLVPVDPARQWSAFRGPGYGIARGTYPESWDGARGINIRWKTPIPLPGENSPVVWGNSIFLSGATAQQREVYCFDAHTGTLRWKQSVTDIPRADRSPVEVMDETGYAASTMAVDGTYSCVMFANGDLACFDFNGRRLWAKNLGKPDNLYGHATSLLIHKGRLIVQFDQGHSPDDDLSELIALDLATGRQVWSAARSVPNSWSSPIVINTGRREEIITTGNPWVIAYNPANGQELWQAEFLSGDVAPSPIFAGGLVFAVNTGSALAAIRPGGAGDVEPLWRYYDDLPDIVSPVSNGELIFMVTTYGTLTCINAKTGEKVWSEYIEGEFNSTPIIVGNTLYLMDIKGVMHILSAGRSFKRLGRATLGEGSTCTPAFVDGAIYLRGKQHLYRIGK